MPTLEWIEKRKAGQSRCKRRQEFLNLLEKW